MSSADCHSYSILTYSGGSVKQRDDLVVAEHELVIHLNEKKFISLLCTPRSLRELVVGFLHAEGIIESHADLKQLCIEAHGHQAHVTLHGAEPDFGVQTPTVTTAGGHGGKTLQAGIPCATSPVVSCDALPLDPIRICQLMDDFSRRSELFLRTGGAHSCALSDGNAMLLFEDDIGRHNALDKIIGHTLLQDLSISDKIILTSGRVSSEIVAKVARRGIGAIVSRSAPTSRAIDLARSVGMTLIGFTRGQSLNVYANFSCLTVR